jgi:ribosomal protein S18 acetylase RimI-like enzyme
VDLNVELGLVRRGELTVDSFAEFGRYAAERNASPEWHIGYVGVTSEEIIADFEELESAHVFAVARVGGRLCGLLCVEWDLDIGRAWLLGPWADTAELFDRLYATVRPLIPPGVTERELFCDEANTGIAAFAERNGFGRRGESTLLRFSREKLDGLAPVTLPTLAPEYTEQFIALHDRAFPNTYAPSGVLLERRSSIFVETAGENLLGYVVLKLRPEIAEAQIEYVAVAESARREGVGTRLVTAAVREAFTDPRYQVMDLVTANPAARRLYQRVGFAHHRHMRSFRTS